VGPFFIYDKGIPIPSSAPSQHDFEHESRELSDALKVVGMELQELAEVSSSEVREILLATAEMALDPAIKEESAGFIASGHTASYAMLRATEVFEELLKASGGYLAERASDVANIRDRVLCELSGIAYPQIPRFHLPTVLIASDLAPADTADLKPETTLAIVTEGGGPTSHAAIIARSLGIAALVACTNVVEIASKHRGSLLAVDATEGEITFAPPQTLVDQIHDRMSRIKARKAEPVLRSNEGYKTRDGVTVPIYANIGRSDEITPSLLAGADGVGLLRTEILYLDRHDAPSLQEQIATYQGLFEPFAGKRVIIRTLDAGADKPIPFIPIGTEPNPALGVRGYRTRSAYEEILRTQLHAISEAARSVSTQIWVMAPMITLPSEAESFVHLARDYGLSHAGVMIEVPAAVFHAESITEICDFVSIGTNDLGQYLHAADRESAALAAFNDPWQPALLKAITHIADAGRRHQTQVGVCGESASDPALAAVLLGLGVSSLSCAVTSLPDVTLSITSSSIDECRAAAHAAIASKDADQARRAARAHLTSLTHLGL
jgi:phosphotransferase system enzyme I (PtsI)